MHIFPEVFLDIGIGADFCYDRGDTFYVAKIFSEWPGSLTQSRRIVIFFFALRCVALRCVALRCVVIFSTPGL